MRHFYYLLIVLLLVGCAASRRPREQAIPIANPDKLPPSHGLVLTSPVRADTLQWGAPYKIPLEILWVSGHRMPVRFAAAPGTPSWLKVEITPATVDTTASLSVRLTALSGAAPEGNVVFTLHAYSDSVPKPLEKPFRFYVRRQDGIFSRVDFGTESRNCDSTCARVTPMGELNFFDLRGGGSCTGMPPSDAQRITLQPIPLSPKGYAFGSTCRVAVVYDAMGVLNFINLGLSPRIPLGAALLTLRGASACWLSPDNTLALVAMPGAAIPYEIATGRMSGGPCRLSSDTVTVRVHGNILRAGMCKWELQ